MARFRTGLVVGKFSPLHRGHEALIRGALEACERVIVISYSKPELAGCEAARREQWLAELFPAVHRLVVTDAFLIARAGAGAELTALPSNDAPDEVHRDFCVFLCETYASARVDAVFTSEDYGEGFAQHLTRRMRARNPGAAAVEHVSVDAGRVKVPISASLIRTDVHAHRQWLSPCVYASFVKRVCILGGESSGKSVLAQALAERLGTAFVPEYGRELWVARAGQLAYEDLLAIARRQVELEESRARQSCRYVFCDTSPLTTLFYSLEMYGHADAALAALARRPYDSHILCAPDFEFVQDGTRRDADFRQRQHDWYLERLGRRSLQYFLAEGPLSRRVTAVMAHLAGDT